MTELMRPIDDLLVSEEQDNNLTYFAFAKPNQASPALAPTRASVGECPTCSQAVTASSACSVPVAWARFTVPGTC